ncbi:MAG: PAS domain-containing protein [Cyanobacteria bacterium SBLK]|nr:PAS domain-containing protein [Cyanobacteria bacterium SBLK]
MFSPATALTTAELDLAIVRNPLIVSPETTVMAAIAEMSGVRLCCNTTRNPDQHLDDVRIEARSSCVLVVEARRVIGILTERDVVRLSAEGQSLEYLLMREVMVHPVITLRESAFKDLFFAINLLGQYGIRHLPVLDDRDCLMGLITHESLRQISRPTDILRLRRVTEVTTREVICASPDASILAIAKQMAEHRVSSVVIVESDSNVSPSLKKPIGILTERDLVQFRALNLPLETYRAETVMSAPVFTITPEESLWRVQEMMERHLIRRVVVAGKQGELAGIVTQTSLLQVLNPLELYKVTEVLEAKVECLETERVTLLENRTAELERQVETRTAELERQVKREKLLAELATQIRSSLSLQEILETTVKKIRQVLACDRVGIWQFDENGCGVVVAESTDSPLSLMGERIDDCCFKPDSAESYRQGRIRIVPDIDAIAISDCHREMLLRLQTRAKILVPLLCGEKLWGLLNATESQHPRDWQPEEVELLRALSVQLAIALQQATTYQQLQAELKERQQAEAQLQEMSQRLALATNSANIGVWDLDLATHRLIWDKRMYELYGIDPTESGPVYETWQRGVHPEDMLLAHAALQAAIAGERDFHTEFRVVWPDGQIRFIEAHAIVLRDESGRARRTIGVNWDISDRKQAEAERLQAERVRLELKLLERLFDIILAGYWDWNIAEGQVYLSPSFKRMFGYEDEELSNTLESWQNSIFREDLPSVLNCFDRHVRSQGQIPFYNEVRYRHKNGSAVWAICSGQVIEWDEEGKPLRAIGFNMNISDRKEAEEQSRQLSARLNLAVESAAIGIWDWDIVGDRLIWDDRMHQLYNIAPEDFVGVYQTWLSCVHPSDRSRVETQVRQALEGGLDFDSIFRIVHPDGTVRFIQANALIQYNALGEPQRTIGINYDISDRQESEQIILQQAEREKLLREIAQKIRQSLDLQTIFDTACQEIRAVLQADRVGIFKFYPDTDFNEGEFAAESVAFGFSSVVGATVRDDCFGANYAHLYARGRFFVADNVYQNDLTPCYIKILAALNANACMVMPLLCGEALWGLLCVHQCTSERHWQQAEIDLTQQLANQIAIAIQQANLYEQLQQELKQRQCTQQQLTERNQQLAISNQELARATRLKDEFLANMSHELRTPLNAILGMTEGLQEGIFGEANAQQVQALQTIKQSGTYLLELINDILDLAKIESGQIALEIAPTAVAPLCRSSLNFIKQQAVKKRIQVELELPADLPNLWVDERRVRQVLINLLANAVKFTPEGGRVTLKASDRWISPPYLSGVTWMQSYRTTLKDNPVQGREKARKYLRIAIIDTGIGIAPQHADKLFQPFVQIDSTLNRQYAGTGLGLALVKRIIELHGGEVGLASEVGTGSCFTVGLPCTAGTTATSRSRSPNFSPGKSEKFTGTESPLILLAEDNEANIITVSSYLRAKGYRILAANNGLEAIALARDENPNLILMDIQMPQMDGLEAIRQIRGDLELVDIPIIALTALAMPGDRDRCLVAGADDYLSKPVKLQQLATVVQQLLASREDKL